MPLAAVSRYVCTGHVVQPTVDTHASPTAQLHVAAVPPAVDVLGHARHTPAALSKRQALSHAVHSPVIGEHVPMPPSHPALHGTHATVVSSMAANRPIALGWYVCAPHGVHPVPLCHELPATHWQPVESGSLLVELPTHAVHTPEPSQWAFSHAVHSPVVGEHVPVPLAHPAVHVVHVTEMSPSTVKLPHAAALW